jgi:hypothetical protein
VELGHISGFSISKDKGAGPLHRDSPNCETTKERTLRHVNISTTRDSKDKGARPLHRDSPNRKTPKEPGSLDQGRLRAVDLVVDTISDFRQSGVGGTRI